MSTSAKGNLPRPLSAFIGRQREVDELERLLSESHLVTLTGAGGSGKTRMSIRLAQKLVEEFSHGIWFIEFAPLVDASSIPQAVASVLGVREQTARPLTDQLITHLQNRHAMLIFDNCEHLIAACAGLAEKLLQACPELWILATSRESLAVPGEVIWTVPPLSLPEPQPWRDTKSGESALPAYGQSEAVQLFVQRASTVQSNFHLTLENGGWVAEICRRLDGMPLAIELAAARVRALSVQQIAERLDDRFHLLTEGSRTGPLRQKTLAAALDWSYSLLSAREQNVLQRLSVFAGGTTMEAAEAVCAGGEIESTEVMQVLSNLVNKSLITAGTSERGETRYVMLETIRQYAGQKLEASGAFDETKGRFLNFFVRWAENTKSNMNRAKESLWLERCEVEHDNLRAALGWSLVSAGRAESGLRLALDLVWFWYEHAYYSEGREWLVALIEKADSAEQLKLRAKALYEAAGLAFVQTDYPAARALLEESSGIYREFGPAGRLGLARTVIQLGDLWRQLGNYEKAFSLLQEGLRLMRELNDLGGLVIVLWQLGYYAVSTGEYQVAEQYFTEALPLSRRTSTGSDTAVILSGLGECALRQGDFGRAAVYEEEGLELRRATGEKWGISVSLGNFGWIAIKQNDLAKARGLLMESLTLRREIEDQGGMAWCLEKLARINILFGQKEPRTKSSEYYGRATQLFAAAAALRAPVGSVIDQADQPDYERDLETLRKALGKEGFSNHWAEGEALLLEEVIDRASHDLSKDSLQSEKEKFGGLTAREREVALLISQGKSNRDIARAMTVGPKTVETYVTRILNKLGFDSRVQIATWAIEKQISVPDKP